MPLFEAMFEENPDMREFFKEHKRQIRLIITEIIGYKAKDTVLFPKVISEEDAKLADNLPPLVLVINSGTNTLAKEDELAEKIRVKLVQTLSFMHTLRFGIWVISHGRNGYVEHGGEVPFAKEESS